MKLQFLGTGAGVPSKQRNVSALVLDLMQELGSVWLFDCGEATQHQILRTSIKPRKVDKIFITHLHGDHIYGLPGFLSSRSFQDGTTPVTIYGPTGIETYVTTSLHVSSTHLRYPVYFKEVQDGIIYEDDIFMIKAKKLDHGIASYGYRVEEKHKPGELLPSKLQEIGVKPGPIYQQIKENKYTELPNGQIIDQNDVTGPRKPGKVITILGDTRYTDVVIPFAQASDVLVHEATFAQNEAELAYTYYHATARQAAEIAAAAKVKQLILTHISSRYTGDQSVNLQEEAALVFDHVQLAYDFYEYDLL